MLVYVNFLEQHHGALMGTAEALGMIHKILRARKRKNPVGEAEVSSGVAPVQEQLSWRHRRWLRHVCPGTMLATMLATCKLKNL